MQTFVEYEKRDLMVGLFVVLSVVVIVAVYFFKVHWEGPGAYTITVEFSRISSIKENTKVRLRGYDIGYVKKVEFNPVPTKADVYFQVELAIEKRYPLFQGTRAQIGGGLIGDRFIDLDVPERGEIQLRSGDVIPGEMPNEMGETLDKAREMLRSITRMTRRIDDADIGDKFVRFVFHIRRVADGMDRLSDTGSRTFQNIDRTVTDLRPELKQAMGQVNDHLGQVGSILSSTDTMMVENREQIGITLKALSASLIRLQSLVTNLDSLTTGSRGDIALTLKNLQEATHSFKDLTKHPWKFFTGKVE